MHRELMDMQGLQIARISPTSIAMAPIKPGGRSLPDQLPFRIWLNVARTLDQLQLWEVHQRSARHAISVKQATRISRCNAAKLLQHSTPLSSV